MKGMYVKYCNIRESAVFFKELDISSNKFVDCSVFETAYFRDFVKKIIKDKMITDRIGKEFYGAAENRVYIDYSHYFFPYMIE